MTWQTAPPVDVGSRMDFVAQFLGCRLANTHEVIEVDPERRLMMRTAMPRATTKDLSRLKARLERD